MSESKHPKSDIPDVLLFSRGQNVSPFGKCSVDVKFVLQPLIDDICRRLASNNGGWSDYLRNLLIADAFGHIGVRFGESFPSRDVEQALAVLAFKEHMSTDEYKKKVLFEHVNGRAHVVRMPDDK